MVKKKVVGRRVLSILLCMLMVVCAIPMVAFAAPADQTGAVVLQRSSDDLFLYRNIITTGQEPVYAGVRLGDFPLKTGNAVIRFANAAGTNWGTAYNGTKLAVRWENPETIIESEGTTTQPIRLYAVADENIFIVAEYTFEVQPAELVPTPEISIEPTIDSPVKYKEGLKVSDLTLNVNDAKATVAGEVIEGTFSFTELDKALYVAENIPVSVTFTPDDPTQAKPVTFTIPVTVEKGDIVVTEAPTFTFVYQQNTALKNRSVLHNAVIEGGVIEPSAVTWDFYDETGLKVKDPQADRALEVGNYQIVARARAASGSFNTGFFTVNVVIKADETKTFPMQVNLAGNELHIKADTTYGGYGGKGTVTYTVNDTVVAQNADPNGAVN